MFCPNCGTQVGDNENFCKECGTPVKAQAVAPATRQSPVDQQPVQKAPAPTKAKNGWRRACFVVGLITCILLILESLPVLVIGATMFIIGPVAMIFGASSYDDIFGYGLLLCIGGGILVYLSIMSIVFNGICTKVTAKRPASKCRSLRIIAAVMALVDSLLLLVPVICVNYMDSGAEFLYAILAVTFILALVFLILAIITNIREKKVAS